MPLFNQSLLFGMFSHAANNILEQVPYLNELDGYTGDGDHGTTMLRVCRCIERSMALDKKEWQTHTDELGWAIMGEDGGSAGMLIGNLFIGIAAGLTEPTLAPSQVANAFRCGLDRMAKFSGAHQGDKTMLDALIPAIQSLELQAIEGASIPVMFELAAIAACEGRDATKSMVPTRGRAKNMGESAVGFIDPGAASMSLLFTSFAEYLKQHQD